MVNIELLQICAGLRHVDALVRNSGADSKSWRWGRERAAPPVTSHLSHHNARLIDVERCETASEAIRHSVVLRRNDNELTMSAHLAMRYRVPPGSSSGLLLGRVGSSGSAVATSLEPDALEPPAHQVRP